MIRLGIGKEDPDTVVDDLPPQQRRCVVEDDEIDLVAAEDGDQVGTQPEPHLETIPRGRMTTPVEENPDIHVALPVVSPFGMAAEEIHRSHAEVRVVLEIA